ncbi:MAG: transporter substrate-binding domain-containing protein [Actinomycetota bacterium]|nr:transporter substrate-binding domain-containing protein [Actinomycetota bacterium]
MNRPTVTIGRRTAKVLLLGAAATAAAGSTAAVAGTAPAPLPAAFRSQTLVSPAVVGYPPHAFLTNAHAISGIDPDLSVALGGPLGQKVHLQVASFENSLLGLQRGTYFMVTGSDITASREKTFDMVSYLADHYEFMSLASKPAIGPAVTSLCGLTISTVAADSSIPVLQSDSKVCTSKGKHAITVTTFPDQGSAVLAVESGRANATTATVTNLGYVATQSPGKFRLGGPKYNYVYIGIATKKGNGVAPALAKAINVLIKNGTYHKILAKYGVTDDAVARALVNPNPNVVR